MTRIVLKSKHCIRCQQTTFYSQKTIIKNYLCLTLANSIFAEDYLSTRWFIANYFKLSGKKVKGVKELAVLATEDIYALETFKEFGCNLSLFIKDIVKKHEPEIIVIGGNIANAFSLFKEAVHEQLALLPNRPLIKKAILGEHASVIGAACCWVQVEEYLEQFS